MTYTDADQPIRRKSELPRALPARQIARVPRNPVMFEQLRSVEQKLFTLVTKRPWLFAALALVAIGSLAAMVVRKATAGNWAQPRVGPIVEAIYSLGTVKAERTWQLKTGITVGVTDIFVREGDQVSAGQRIIATDSGRFWAPFPGTITKITIHKGEILMPGLVAVQLMDLRDRYILLSLDQPSALRVREGQKAEVSVESIRGRKLVGRVGRIYPSDSQFLVRVHVDQMPGEILPDMTADVAIEVDRREKALLVPLAAVRRGQVTVRRNGRQLKPVQAKIGAVNGEFAEILDGSVLPTDEVLLSDR